MAAPYNGIADQVFLMRIYGSIDVTRCFDGQVDDTFSVVQKIDDASLASRVAAVPVDSSFGSGVVVLYHAAASPIEISFQIVADNGTIVSTGIWQA